MIHLEYSDDDLLVGGDALWIKDVGYIAQYHCYCDMLYSHNIIYYARDYFAREVHRRLSSGEDASVHEKHLASLNSKISVHEASS